MTDEEVTDDVLEGVCRGIEEGMTEWGDSLYELPGF